MNRDATSFDFKPLSKPQISLETLYYDEERVKYSKSLNKENFIDTINSNEYSGIKYSTDCLKSDITVNSNTVNMVNALFLKTINGESDSGKQHSGDYEKLSQINKELERVKEKRVCNVIQEVNENEHSTFHEEETKIPLKKNNPYESNFFKKPSGLFSSKIATTTTQNEIKTNKNFKDLSINSNASSLATNCPQESTPIYNCEI